MPLKLSEEEFQKIQNRINKAKGKSSLVKKDLAQKEKKPKNSKAKKQKTILTSLINANININFTNKGVGFYYEGARLYTLNELFAMLQYHKFNIFNYKKACHNLIERTVSQIHSDYPDRKKILSPPLRIYLYRSSDRKVDNDSLSSMYKYLIDGLVKNFCEIDDDNPDIIYDYIPFQETIKQTNKYAVGLFLEEVKRKKNLSANKMFNLKD